IGGFPAEAYYGGSAASATVTLPAEHQITGGQADFDAANARMRHIRGPNWRQPSDHTWNHAGPPGSRTIELARTDAHAPVHHRGNAANARAAARAEAILARARSGGAVRTNGFAMLAVYLTVRDAVAAAGVGGLGYEVREHFDYCFVDGDSVFIVQVP